MTVPSAGETIARGSSGIFRGGLRKKLMSQRRKISGTIASKHQGFAANSNADDDGDERQAEDREIVRRPTSEPQLFERGDSGRAIDLSVR